MDKNDILDDFDQGYKDRARHGCVSAWLILMIIGNAFVSVFYLFFWDSILELVPDESMAEIPDINPILLGVVGVANLIFAILLFKWKKVGFWGFVGTSVITLGLNISAGLGVGQILTGFAGIAILYGILQIKERDVSAWDNLE